MKIRIDPMTEDLRRQRRNLIVISFILCFMKFGGIVIAKTTIFGTEIKFSNISAIFFALWLMWLYFSVRYYQYFMQEGLTKIRVSLSDILTDKCRSKIATIVLAEHPNVQGSSSQTFDYNVLKKDRWYSIIFIGQESIEEGVYDETEEFKMNISLWVLWKEVLKSYYNVFVNQSVMTDYVFPGIFAVFTLIYCNLDIWEGQIINLIKKI